MASSEHHNNNKMMFHEELDEAGGRSRSSRSRKSNSGKGPKKPPQRGLGVAQLERLRLQESWKKITEGSSSGVPTLHDHHQQLLSQCHHTPPSQVFPSGGVPVRYAAPSSPAPSLEFQFQCPHQQQQQQQQHVMNGYNNVVGGGWILPNRVGCSFGSGHPLLLGTPLETSKELSSMPNLHSQPHYFDFCLKKTRFNEGTEKEPNARRERALETFSNGHDFLGLMQQPSSAPSFVGETSEFYNKLVSHDVDSSAYTCATPNLDECVEVVAVHRRGNSGSGRVFMEYEFFPGKDGRDTSSKELEFPTKGSVSVGSGEASSITTSAYGDSASNYIDLSLKLSR